jgi:hypothetical protein
VSKSDADAPIAQDAQENAQAALARLDRDQLIELCAKQRIFIEEQHQSYVRLFNELNDLRKQVGEVKALGVRKHLLFTAADAERDLSEPLQ